MARRVAVVGSGISGLAAAWQLAPLADVTLFESGHHFGGHANTVDITLAGIPYGVDTGFLVFNQRTYPLLVRLFAELGVQTAPSEMSFSVQCPDRAFEWSGSNLDAVFAQRSNLLRPRFWWMLREVVRFNRLARSFIEADPHSESSQTVDDFLTAHRFGAELRDGYLLPMIACIWSCPAEQMLRFPIATLLRFCDNHGLISIGDRPQWHTVRSGSRHYVQRMLQRLSDTRLATPVRQVQRVPARSGDAGVWLATDHGRMQFDDVVLACHSDQALALLAEPSAAERRLLGAIGYQRNRAVLHTDIQLLPRRRKAWAAWNYERSTRPGSEASAVCLHYLINRLQPLPWSQPVIVSLNPVREPDRRLVHAQFDYAHPVFDFAAVAAQRQLADIQGVSHVWFCGAWAGYGFHEDGLRSGLATADALVARWRVADAGASRRAA